MAAIDPAREVEQGAGQSPSVQSPSVQSTPRHASHGGSENVSEHGSEPGSKNVSEHAPENTPKHSGHRAPKHLTKRAVLTRPAARQQALAGQLRQSGCEVLELPALTISPIRPGHPNEPSKAALPDAKQEIGEGMGEQSNNGALNTSSSTSSNTPSTTSSHIANKPTEQVPSHAEVAKWQPEQFDALVFVSRSAWQFYQQFYLPSGWRLGMAGEALGGAPQPETSVGQPLLGPSALHTPPILACVGQSTAKQIASDLDIPLARVVYPPDGVSADSEGLWSVLKGRLNSQPGSEAKVLIVRGQSGRDWLADTLAEQGVSVTCLSVYQREPAVWTEQQINTLTRWAGEGTEQNSEQSFEHGFEHSSEHNPGPHSNLNTGTWLITSGEGLAAIEGQYQLHGLTGKPGFKPQSVVVVHERLKAPVCRWLDNWTAPESNSDPKRSGVSVPRTAASHGHTDGEPRKETPVLVVATDDEAIAAAILRGG